MPPYGRGGAGNIQPIDTKTPEDLEANQSSARHPSAIDYPPREDQVYRHTTGRGGAGNLMDPSTLNTPSPHTNAATTPHALESKPATTYGRGGAGNHEFLVGMRRDEDSQQAAEEGMSRMRLEEIIAKVVDEKLATPQKAKLAHGEPS